MYAYQRWSALRRLHYATPGYWTGAAATRCSSNHAESDDPPQPATSPPQWERPPVPVIRSIIENLQQIRRSGQKITDVQEHGLYKLYRQFLKGGNLTLVDQSICHLYETIQDDDVKSMRKLTRRLETKEWYGLAYEVQRIMAAKITGPNAIKSYKRLADLAMKNRDYDKAELALEEAQSRIVEMLLEKAAAVEDTDIDKALQLYEDANEMSSDVDKAQVSFKYSTLLLRRSDQKAAVAMLEKALDCSRLATKAIIANKGMVPKYLVPKVEALPGWNQRIDQRLAELKKTGQAAV